MGSNFSNTLDAWNRLQDPGAYAVADAIRDKDAKRAVRVEQLEEEVRVRDLALEMMRDDADRIIAKFGGDEVVGYIADYLEAARDARSKGGVDHAE